MQKHNLFRSQKRASYRNPAKRTFEMLWKVVIILTILGIFLKLLAPKKRGCKADLSRRAVRKNYDQKPDDSD